MTRAAGVLLAMLYIILLVIGGPIALGWITDTGGIGFGFGISLVLLVIQYRNLRYARQSIQWPTAPGQVVESCVIHSGTSGNSHYTPHVKFSFTVEGKQYSANTVSLKSHPVAGRQSAEEHIAPFPVGRKVVVRYNPKIPHVAVLEPGVGGGTIFLFGLFMTGAVVAGIFFFAHLEPIRWSERFEELRQIAYTLFSIDER